jgi:hypothetical protein
MHRTNATETAAATAQKEKMSAGATPASLKAPIFAVNRPPAVMLTKFMIP